MTYSVQVSHSTAAYLRRLDRPARERVARKFVILAEQPFDPQHSKPLTNREGQRSARVGAWRILFTVDTDSQTIRVDTIAPRGQVYRNP